MKVLKRLQKGYKKVTKKVFIRLETGIRILTLVSGRNRTNIVERMRTVARIT